jgi:hypothetical protein
VQRPNVGKIVSSLLVGLIIALSLGILRAGRTTVPPIRSPYLLAIFEHETENAGFEVTPERRQALEALAYAYSFHQAESIQSVELGTVIRWSQSHGFSELAALSRFAPTLDELALGLGEVENLDGDLPRALYVVLKESTSRRGRSSLESITGSTSEDLLVALGAVSDSLIGSPTALSQVRQGPRVDLWGVLRWMALIRLKDDDPNVQRLCDAKETLRPLLRETLYIHVTRCDSNV